MAWTSHPFSQRVRLLLSHFSREETESQGSEAGLAVKLSSPALPDSTLFFPSSRPMGLQCQRRAHGVRDKLKPGCLAEVRLEHLGRVLLSDSPPSTGVVGKEPLAHLLMTFRAHPCLCSSGPLLRVFLSIVSLHLRVPAPVLQEASPALSDNLVFLPPT